MPEIETPPAGETTPPTPSEPTAAPQAPGTEVTEPAKQDTKVAEELAAMQKELDKAKMRASQLENAAAKAERERIEKDADATEQAEYYKKQLEERDAAAEAVKAKEEANKFQLQVIEKLDVSDAVKKAAKALVAKDPNNLSWNDAPNWEDAERQVTEQVMALASVIAPAAPDGGDSAPTQHPNNPAPIPEKQMAGMSVEELRKVLPNANRTY